SCRRPFTFNSISSFFIREIISTRSRLAPHTRASSLAVRLLFLHPTVRHTRVHPSRHAPTWLSSSRNLLASSCFHDTRERRGRRAGNTPAPAKDAHREDTP